VHPIEKLLDEAAAAMEEERFPLALEKSEAALKLAPRDLEALATKAAALEELGRLDEALDVYDGLRRLEPGEPTWTLAAASLLIHAEEAEEGLELLEQIERQAQKDPRLHFDWLLLTGVGLNQAGELTEALASLEKAVKLFPDELEAQIERAVVLFELSRFDEAKKAFEELGEEPMALHHLGLIAERRGDEKEAARLFGIATELDPEAFPVAVRLGEAEFDAALSAAVEGLPAHAREQLGNTTIAVEPFPDDESLRSGEVTPSILGVFQGTPLDERLATSAEDHHTARIVLYQRNLERYARTREELIEQIGVTVLHEVGHLLGLDEDELKDRGLD
jgi:predicted Zn-dependent protease with MMP-like domain/cytochrome c-type biogenesis protein CcmH/NrfG